MDERPLPPEVGRRLGRWLQEEVQVPAPDQLIEDVFARTTEMAQVSRRWPGLIRRRGPRSRRPNVALGVALVVLVAVALAGAALRGSPDGQGAAATPLASQPAATSAASDLRTPPLVVDRTHQTCSHSGPITILQGVGSASTSVWVTCGADSQEIVLGTDAVVARPGLGTIASDAGREWAIRGDSIVRLNPDRTVAGSVRIGTPGALAVSGPTVWVLDVHTGVASSVGAMTIGASVRPAPARRPIAIAIAGGSVWVLDQTGDRLLRLDLADGHELTAVPIPSGSTMLVQAAGALYVASPPTKSIVRVDPATATTTTLALDLESDGNLDALGGSADGLVIGSRTTVARLDPLTGRLLWSVIGRPYVVAVGLSGTTAVILDENGLLTESPMR